MTEAQKIQLEIYFTEYKQVYYRLYATISKYVRAVNPELAEAKWGKVA
jgi:hypothetical protein